MTEEEEQQPLIQKKDEILNISDSLMNLCNNIPKKKNQKRM